jgi:hypothetical protein
MADNRVCRLPGGALTLAQSRRLHVLRRKRKARASWTGSDGGKRNGRDEIAEENEGYACVPDL